MQEVSLDDSDFGCTRPARRRARMVGRDRERPHADVPDRGDDREGLVGGHKRLAHVPHPRARRLGVRLDARRRYPPVRRGARRAALLRRAPWKRPSPEKGLGEASQIVLSIEVEHSPRRSAAVAPGSRGLGYDLARRDGTVRHYLTFPTAERLEWPSASSRGGRGRRASVTIASPAPGSSTCSTAIPARLHACATSSLRSRGDTAARTTAAKSSAAKCGARSSSHNRAQ